jgi:hypothetical protein
MPFDDHCSTLLIAIGKDDNVFSTVLCFFKSSIFEMTGEVSIGWNIDEPMLREDG